MGNVYYSDDYYINKFNKAMEDMGFIRLDIKEDSDEH